MSPAAIRILGAVLALAGSAEAHAAPPRDIEIVYDLLTNGVPVGAATTRLQWGAGRYSIVEQVRGRGAFARKGEAQRSSRGSVTREGLRPQEFEDRRTGRDTARARFDWSARSVTLQYKGEPRTEALPAGTHDQLSLLFGFAFRSPGSRPLRVHVSDGRRLAAYAYRVAGRERVKTPAGQFEALKLVKEKDAPDDSGMEIWLAAERHFLPVKIVLVDKRGVRVEQTAVRLTLQ
jgi:hypothetical protein